VRARRGGWSADAADGVHTHLIICRSAIPLMLRTVAAYGTQSLVIEMTDGTSADNAEFRRNVGFYYDLVKANVERIVNGLTAELTGHSVTAVGVTLSWLPSEKMLENFGVSEQTWREACVKTPGLASRSRPSMSPEVSPRSSVRPTPAGGPTRSLVPGSWQTPTASPTPTAAGLTPGATWRPMAGNPRTAKGLRTSAEAA